MNKEQRERRKLYGHHGLSVKAEVAPKPEVVEEKIEEEVVVEETPIEEEVVVEETPIEEEIVEETPTETGVDSNEETTEEE